MESTISKRKTFISDIYKGTISKAVGFIALVPEKGTRESFERTKGTEKAKTIMKMGIITKASGRMTRSKAKA
jgi:hypothetical protein